MSLIALLGTTTAQAQVQQECVTAHAGSQVDRLGGKLLAARRKLLFCAQSTCPAPIASECTAWLAEVEESLSTVVFAVSDVTGRDLVEVRVAGNGKRLAFRTDGRAVQLDPGTYEFLFEADGYAPLKVSATIRQSEKNRIVRVRLDSLGQENSVPDPGPKTGGANTAQILSYVFGGVALAGFGTFGVFAVVGTNEYEDLKDKCENHCTEDQVAAGKRAYIIADIGLGIGIASAITAVVFHFAGQGNESDSASAALPVQAALMKDGMFVQWTARD